MQRYSILKNIKEKHPFGELLQNLNELKLHNYTLDSISHVLLI